MVMQENTQWGKGDGSGQLYERKDWRRDHRIGTFLVWFAGRGHKGGGLGWRNRRYRYLTSKLASEIADAS